MNSEDVIPALLKYITGPSADARIDALVAVYAAEHRLKKSSARNYQVTLNTLFELVRTARINPDSSHEEVDQAINKIERKPATIKNYTGALHRLATWLANRNLLEVEQEGRRLLQKNESLRPPVEPVATKPHPHLSVVRPADAIDVEPAAPIAEQETDAEPHTAPIISEPDVSVTRSPRPADVALRHGLTELGRLVQQIQETVIPALAADTNSLFAAMEEQWQNALQEEQEKASKTARALESAQQEAETARQTADAAKQVTTTGILAELAKSQEIAKLTAQIAERDARIRELATKLETKQVVKESEQTRRIHEMEGVLAQLRKENESLQEQLRTVIVASTPSNEQEQSGERDGKSAAHETAEIRRVLQDSREEAEGYRKGLETATREITRLQEQNASLQAEQVKLQRRLSRLERDNADYLARLQAAHWASEERAHLTDLGLPADIATRLAGASGQVTIGDLAALITLQGQADGRD